MNGRNFLSESRSEHDRPIQLIHGDVLTQPLENASVSVLNLTLQFLPFEARAGLVERIYRNTRPGEFCCLPKKSLLTTSRRSGPRVLLELKRANGYSELEIAQKRTALKRTGA